ncbi:MAG: hypothetical protein SV186_02050 [Candidatus Nanohaloarchaea archaeon]|nr:hypothetical protein [Candidatus Nanohaloarchaea archaeon]
MTEDDLARQVHELLRESGSPLSTKAVADRLDVDWHTAKKRLERLADEGKAHRKQFRSNMTLWWDKEIPL